MMEHKLHDREDGLHHCRVCNGAEASLPVNCPGRRMTSAEEAAVWDGYTDFVGGALVRAEVFALHARAWRFVVGDALDPRSFPTRPAAQRELRMRLRALDSTTEERRGDESIPG